MELKQCFLAHGVDITAKLIQKFFHQKGLNTYLLEKDQYQDFEYLINDLSPNFILVHEDVWSAAKDSILSHFEKFPGLRKGILGKGVPSEVEWDIVLTEPIDPSILFDQISSQLAQNLN